MDKEDDFSSQASQQAQDQLQNAASKAGKAGKAVAGKAIRRAARKAASTGLKALGKALISTPAGWIILGIIGLAFVIVIVLFGVQSAGDFNLNNRADAADKQLLTRYETAAKAAWPGVISLYGQEVQTQLSWGAVYAMDTLAAQSSAIDSLPYKMESLAADMAQTQEFKGAFTDGENVRSIECSRANGLPCYVYQSSQVKTVSVCKTTDKDGKTTTVTTSQVQPVWLLVHAKSFDHQGADGMPGSPYIDGNGDLMSKFWYDYKLQTTSSSSGDCTVTVTKEYPWGTYSAIDNSGLNFAMNAYITHTSPEKILPVDRLMWGQMTLADNRNMDLEQNAPWLTHGGPIGNNPMSGIGSASLAGVPQELVDAVKAAAQRFGIDWAILAALLYQESNFCQNAVPSMGADGQSAYGCAQFEMATWQEYGIDANGDGIADVNNPIDAIFGAANYLSHLGMTTDPSSWAMALKRYNCGWAAAAANPDCDIHNGKHYSDEIISRAQQFRQGGIPGANGSIFLWPTPGTYTITSDFGQRSNPFGDGGEFHAGIDIGAACGTPIVAAASGTVIAAGPASGYGQWIVIDSHNGYLEIYGHMFPQGVLVHQGQNVPQGQEIGLVGSNGEATGCHLHFGVWQGSWPVNVAANGQYVDPKPLLYMPKQS